MSQSKDKDIVFCKLALECMRFSEESGNYRSLQLQIEAKHPTMQECTDQKIRTEYTALLARVANARAYEQLHGEGSLLNLNHPSVQRHIKRRLIGEERVAAATAQANRQSRSELTSRSVIFPSSVDCVW